MQLALENLSVELLMKTLEQEWVPGRDDFPLCPMWNALVAGPVFQDPTVEALLQELRCNRK